MTVSFRSNMCLNVAFFTLEFRDCEPEIDIQWSIKWNKTSPKHYDTQTCPGEFPIGLLYFVLIM